MRVLSLFLALLLAACAPPDAPPDPSDEPSADPPPDTMAVDGASADGFDAQAWLAEARGLAFDPETSDYDDETTARMKALAAELGEAADWRRACDTYPDYETGEPVYERIPDSEAHWARGTLEIGEVGETEAIVAVTCDFGAYQGSYALVHISGDRAAVLRAPALDEGGQPSGGMMGVFGTPDFFRADEGFVYTFSKSRGIGDCGTYVAYDLAYEEGVLDVREVRQRDCGAEIPDELPPPEEWPVVYTG